MTAKKKVILIHNLIYKNKKCTKNMGYYIENFLSSAWISKYEKENGKKIILARGTFDTPHEGHLDFLQRAKDLGDILMVNVNNDLWCERRKRETVMTEAERARFIAWQAMVDYVFVHPSYDIHPAIELAIICKPDIFVREDKKYPEFPELEEEEKRIQEEEKRIFLECLDYPIDYRVLPRSDKDISSSELMRRIQALAFGGISFDDIERYERIIGSAKDRLKIRYPKK